MVYAVTLTGDSFQDGQQVGVDRKRTAPAALQFPAPLFRSGLAGRPVSSVSLRVGVRRREVQV